MDQHRVYSLIDRAVREIAPWQCAGGILLGVWLSLSPIGSLTWLFLVCLAISIRINFVAVFLGFSLSLPFSLFCSEFGKFEQLGRWILLDLDFLLPFWSSLAELPIFPHLGITNSHFMGRLTCALLISVPLYTGLHLLLLYRGKKMARRFKNTHLCRLILGTKLYRTYMRYVEATQTNG